MQNISNTRDHTEYEILASPSCTHLCGFSGIIVQKCCMCCAGQTDRKYAVNTPTLCGGKGYGYVEWNCVVTNMISVQAVCCDYHI